MKRSSARSSALFLFLQAPSQPNKSRECAICLCPTIRHNLSVISGLSYEAILDTGMLPSLFLAGSIWIGKFNMALS